MSYDDKYGAYYRAWADKITDAELRSRGMSAHELLRVRALADEEQVSAIAAFLLRDTLS